jgi:capsular exopolysaccharide synthesis family protein
MRFAAQGAYERMEFRPYLNRLREWAWALVLGTLVSAGLGYVIARQLPPVYEASTTLLVNVSPAGGLPTYNDVMLSQQLVKTYATLALQPVLLERAATQLGLALSPDDLRRMVDVQPVRDTQLITIAVRSPVPDDAQRIANTLASVFIEEQQAWFPAGSGGITVVQPALLPAQPIEPRVPVIVGLAAVLGLLLVVGMLFAWDYLDDHIRSAAELDRVTALPAIGTVMQLSRRDGVSEPSRLLDPSLLSSPAEEVYGLVRTRLDLASLDRPWKVLLVTSALPGEGKSTTAANLALALARSGRRVALVDANLRDPAVHRLFGLPNTGGLTEFLLASQGHSAINATPYLKRGPVPSLQLVTAGESSPQASQLLQSSALLNLLQQLEPRVDVVLLDGPATLGGADALLLAQAAEATLLVVDAQRASTNATREAANALRQTETYLVGGLLNRFRRQNVSFLRSAA